jgi:hypothetical protein
MRGERKAFGTDTFPLCTFGGHDGPSQLVEQCFAHRFGQTLQTQIVPKASVRLHAM